MNAARSAAPAAGGASRANRRLAFRLFAVTAAMFGFGYALVPLYDFVCDVTGFNGRTGVVSEPAPSAAAAAVSDPDRVVKVQFVATVNSGLRWEFSGPAEPFEVSPGRVYEADFSASNLSNRPVVGQAVPSVSPVAAAAHFNKIECFCFTRQRLEPGETRTMPVRFVVDEEIPERIGILTLGYTFFEAEPVARSPARSPAASDGIGTNG